MVAVEGDVDPAGVNQGEAVAVVGARVGTIIAMDGADVAHPDTAPGPLLGQAPGPPPGQGLGRARAGAAPAMHAAAEVAADRGGAAGHPARVPRRGARARLGLPRSLLVVGIGGGKAAGSAGAAAVKAAYGIPAPGSVSNS